MRRATGLLILDFLAQTVHIDLVAAERVLRKVVVRAAVHATDPALRGGCARAPVGRSWTFVVGVGSEGGTISVRA